MKTIEEKRREKRRGYTRRRSKRRDYKREDNRREEKREEKRFYAKKFSKKRRYPLDTWVEFHSFFKQSGAFHDSLSFRHAAGFQLHFLVGSVEEHCRMDRPVDVGEAENLRALEKNA